MIRLIWMAMELLLSNTLSNTLSKSLSLMNNNNINMIISCADYMISLITFCLML